MGILSSVEDGPGVAARPPAYVLIGNEAAPSILSHARGAHPREACGLLLGRPDGPGLSVNAAPGAPNRADDTRRTYRICDVWLFDQLRRDEAAGPDRVLGAYHSHPDGHVTFSRRDLAEAWPGWLYLVTATPSGQPQFGAWWVDHAGVAIPLPVRTMPD